MSETAVILMAYGSPERVADVPAYYADIRGGRPISPEHLEDLVARYRALGIEDANPLNAITEATRAALETELGLPVFTGHEALGPRIADAVEAASQEARHVSSASCSRPTTADSRSPAIAFCSKRRSPAASRVIFVESWHDDPGSIAFLADRIRDTMLTSSSRRTHFRRASSTDGDPYQDQLLETAQARRRQRRGRGLVVLVPERVADR